MARGSPPMLIALNKPFQVLTQFTASEGKSTLTDHVHQRTVYPVGRLDFDSEGLLLLTDDGALQHAIAEPRRAIWKRYWVQVEGVVNPAALARLEKGIALDGRMTAPSRARLLSGDPPLWTRVPGIRVRREIPTSWLELGITEGRNRQVRRMTAAVGFPTLRLVRVGIGELDLIALGLMPGESRVIDPLQLGPKLLQMRTLGKIAKNG
jgi:23S rRNA pseudouridine2457 synthase